VLKPTQKYLQLRRLRFHNNLSWQ